LLKNRFQIHQESVKTVL